MGKVELKLEIDADLLELARAAGVEPQRAAEQGIRDALAETPRRWSFVESAREKAKDPEGAERRAREWAEANREAIEEHNQRIAERGLLSDYKPFKPRWLG